MADPILQSPPNPHFFKPLLPGFDSYIDIPDKFFSLHIQGRTERKTVELKSEASETIWEVLLEGQRLISGWKEFAVAHAFRVGDVVIFRHDGDFLFHVSGFGPSFSEIQYVQSCNLDDEEKDEDIIRKPPRKKQAKETNGEVEVVSFSSDESCFVAHVTDSNLRDDSLYLRKNVGVLDKRGDKIVLKNIKGLKTWTLALKFKESSRSFYMRAGWRIFCRENELKPGDSVTFKRESNNTETPVLCFSAAESKKVIPTRNNGKGKRIETGESSRRASSSSSSSSSSLNENRFVTLNVTPDSFKHCRIVFPVRFTRVNKMESEGGKTITLLDKHGVAWPVKLIMVSGRRMRLASGLKEFLKANGIKADESFVLELVWEDKTSPPVLKFCSKKIGT